MVTRLLTFAAAGCLLLTSTAIAQPHLQPNTVKYKDTSKQPATGRSGDATITAHALRGKDGNTDLYVTSNGSIDKVQVKIGDITKNFTGSGSTFTTALGRLGRRTPVDIQVNVSGADAARTGVVSATETVKMRPELVVQYVTRPPHTLAGAPTHISADVGEMYGDTGARTDCVLLQDGVEIDRAEDIWVNADGIVACEFATAFPVGTGTANLQVKLADTFPADYDESSNVSEPFSIKVYDRLTELEQWTAMAMDVELSDYYLSRSNYGESESYSNGQRSGLLFHAFFRRTEPYVPSIRASMRVTTDGTPWPIFDAPDVWFDHEPEVDWGGYWQRCAVSWIEGGDYVSGSYIRSCNINSFMDGQYSTFTFSLNSSDVTYVSRGWYAWYAGGPPMYVWFYNWHSMTGSGFRLGDTVNYDVSISDGTNYWAANPTVNLTTTTRDFESPYTCYEYPEWNYWSCGATWSHTVKKEGWAYGGTQ